MLSPHSPSQELEERVDRLITEIYGVTLAASDPVVMVGQSIETQLLLSFLQERVVPHIGAVCGELRMGGKSHAGI